MSRGGHKSEVESKSKGIAKKVSVAKQKAVHPAYGILKKVMAKDPNKFKD